MVEKNVFYHNKGLVKEPRRYSVEKLKSAGISRKCITCCGHIKIHLKKHNGCSSAMQVLSSSTTNGFQPQILGKGL